MSVSRTVQPLVPVLRFQDYVNSRQSLDRIVIAQFNVNSLLGHLDLVQAHLHSNFYHIISISETWLHDGIPDDMIRLGDYLLVRNDREGKRGGGVACYVRRSLRVRLLAVSPSVFSNSPEYMILEIGCPGADSLLFTTMYRRPKAILFNEFFNVLSRYSFAYKNIIIGGDLNCNLLGAGFGAASFRESVSSHALGIVDSDSTFHTSIADPWLDVFILDYLANVLSFQKSEAPFIAGHDLIELSYRFEKPPIQARIISRRSYGGFKKSAYRDVLERALDADCLLETGEVLFIRRVDCLLNSFQNAIISTLDDQVPLRSFRVCRPGAPWLSVVLRARSREHNALYRRMRRSGSVLEWAEYRRFRDVLVADLRWAQSDHCLERLNGVTDVAKLWRQLANLGLVRPYGSFPLSFFTGDQLNLFFCYRVLCLFGLFDYLSYDGP